MTNTARTRSVAAKEVIIANSRTTSSKRRRTAPPFAHRTPNQLHASIYAAKHG